jgi:hypothetical protein
MKIAIFNGFIMHYEMYGYIIDYCKQKNYSLDIYSCTEENMEWLKFYIINFPKTFRLLHSDKYRYENDYNHIILITEEDPFFYNFWINYKIISINHSPFSRRNNMFKNYINTRPHKHYDNWILPVYKLINVPEKQNISKNNVICLGGNALLSDDDIKRFKDFDKYNFILIDRRDNKDKYKDFKNITFYHNLSAIDMIKLVKESNYMFISDNNKDHIDTSMSASIPLGLNCLCTLIMPYEMNIYYKFKSVITYEKDIIIREPDLNLVNNDLENMLTHRNNTFDKFIK